MRIDGRNDTSINELLRQQRDQSSQQAESAPQVSDVSQIEQTVQTQSPEQAQQLAQAQQTQLAQQAELTQQVQQAELAQQAQAPEPQQGVIRNILDGHFKGVADVRLRLNFHDELQALSTRAARDAAPEAGEKLLDGFAEAESRFLAEVDAEQAEQAKGAFDSFREDAEDILGDQETDPSELAAALNDRFQALKDELAELDARQQDEIAAIEAHAQEEEVIEEVAAQAAPRTEDTVDLSERLATLEAEFGTGLAEFQAQLADVSDLLPPLSEAQGNGRAYARFAAQYAEMAQAPADPAAVSRLIAVA
jgi:hypothetical protein